MLQLSNKYTCFAAYCAEAGADDHDDVPLLEEQLMCQPTRMVPDQESVESTEDKPDKEKDWLDNITRYYMNSILMDQHLHQVNCLT